jgi:hypothetical protein
VKLDWCKRKGGNLDSWPEVLRTKRLLRINPQQIETVDGTSDAGANYIANNLKFTTSTPRGVGCAVRGSLSLHLSERHRHYMTLC